MGGLCFLAVGLAVGLSSNFFAFFSGLLLEIHSHYALMAVNAVLVFVFWLLLEKLISGAKVVKLEKNTCKTVSLLPFVFLLISFWGFMSKAWIDIPGIFDSWDAVASWNRWAIEWFQESKPIYTSGYPQLLPTAIAQIYVWFRSTDVQPVVKLFLMIFGLLPLLLFIDGFIRFRSDKFIWAGAFWLACIAWMYPDLMNSGYADVPGACFVAVTAYFLLLGTAGGIGVSASLYLGALSAAAAVLTKQPAGLAWLIWLGIAGRIWFLHPAMRSVIFKAAVLFVIVSAPWYLYVAFSMIAGSEASNILYLVQGIHESRGWLERFVRALKIPLWEILSRTGYATELSVFVSLVLLFSCLNSWGRWLVGAIVGPFFLLWALLFSYDARNLLPVVPILCMALGVGAWVISRRIGNFLGRKNIALAFFEKYNQDKPAFYVILAPFFAFWIFVIYALSAYKSVASLEVLQRDLQYQSGSIALNQKLLDYEKNIGFQGQVLTTYVPMVLIPELARYTNSFKEDSNLYESPMLDLLRGAEFCEVLKKNHSFMNNIRYLLIHDFIHSAVIDKAISSGDLKIEWKVDGIQLIKIDCNFSEFLT